VSVPGAERVGGRATG